MKIKFYLSVILMIPVQFSFAQTYHPFPSGNTIWAEYYRPHFDSSFRVIYFGLKDRDTVINGQTYHKLYRSADTIFQETEFYGGLREDVAARKVYRNIPGQGLGEILLFDFNLNVGDTLKANANGGRNNWAENGNQLTVVVVDSVLLDGSYRKRMNLRYAGSPMESAWVEGVGNLVRGLFFFPGDLPNNGTMNELLCMRQHDQWIYHATSSWFINSFTVPDCDSLQILNPHELGISPTIAGENAVRFYPNPMNGESRLTIKEPGKYELLEIYNIAGSRIRSLSPSLNRELVLDHKDFVPGLYIYRLRATDGNCATGRFTVE